MHHTGRNFVGAELVERLHDGFRRALHIGLDQDREFLFAAFFQLAHHLFQR